MPCIAPHKDSVVVSRALMQEVDELVRDWKPEPLVPEKSATAPPRLRTPLIDEITGAHATIDGVSGILHLASYNFWGLAGHPSIQVLPSSVQNTHVFHHSHKQGTHSQTEQPSSLSTVSDRPFSSLQDCVLGSCVHFLLLGCWARLSFVQFRVLGLQAFTT